MGLEATATLKRLSSCLATKWWQPYPKTCGHVKSRIAITLVRSNHRCIRVSRVPAHRISVQRPQWEDGAGLKLFWRACQGPNRTNPIDTLSPPRPPTTQHPQNLKTPQETRAKGGVVTNTKIQEGDIKARAGGQDTPVSP